MTRSSTAYGFCFAGSLGVAEVEPLPDAEPPEVEPLPEVVPLAALSLDELELDEDGEDGLDGAGVAGVVLLRLELLEPDGEDGEDDGEVVLPLPDVVLSAPRSQAAIRLAPSARDTATAKVWNFMYYLLELGCMD